MLKTHLSTMLLITSFVTSFVTSYLLYVMEKNTQLFSYKDDDSKNDRHMLELRKCQRGGIGRHVGST